MKSKCSFILKASTALVLAMLVLFGSIATVVGAVAPADKGESDIAAVARKVADIADTGAKADLAESGVTASNKKLYLKPGIWGNASGDIKYYVAAYNSSGRVGFSAVATTVTVGSDTYYVATCPNGCTNGYRWVRGTGPNGTHYNVGPWVSDNKNASYVGGWANWEEGSPSSSSTYNVFADGETIYVDANGNSYWSSYDISVTNNWDGGWGGNNMTKIATGLYKYTQSGNWDCGNNGIKFYRGGSSKKWNLSKVFDIGSAYFAGNNAMYMGSSAVYDDVGTQTTLSLTSISAPTLTATSTTPTAGDSNTITAAGNTLNYTRGGTAKTTTLLSTDAKYNFYVDGSSTAAQSSTTKTYDASGLTAGSHTITCKISSSLTGLTSSAGSITITVSAPATTYTDITAVAKGTTDGSNYSVSLGTIQSSTTVSASTGLAVNAGTQSGYTFYKWVASGSGTFDDATSASTTFHPAANSEIATAQYKKNYTFSNGTTDTHGTVTIPSDTKLAGASYSGTVTPADGYKIKTLTVGGVAVSGAVGKTSAYTYSGTTGTSNTGTTTPISVVATFEPITDLNLYIAGRFHIYNGTTWVNSFDSGDWANDGGENIKFTYVSGTTYKVETGASPAELTSQISNNDPWFFVYDKTNSKGWHATTSNRELTASATEFNLTTNTDTYNVKFNSTSTDKPVTIYFDYNTKKLWYSIPDYYDVTVSNPATGGTVTASSSRAEAGAEITLTVNPTAGYELTSLTAKDADNGTVTITNNKFTMPAKNVTVTPVFSKITWSGLDTEAKFSTTGASGSYNTTMTYKPTKSAASGTQIDGITVTADEYKTEGGVKYKFYKWSPVSTDGTVASDTALSTTFYPKKASAVCIALYKKIYTITSNVDSTGKGAGTVTTNKEEVEAGGSYVITSTAKNNSRLESVKVNNTADTTTTPLTKNNVTADQNVVVKFASNSHLIGKSGLCSANWATPGDELTSNSEGTSFSITRSDVPAGTYEFKHYSWNGSAGSYDGTAIAEANQTLNGIATLDNTGENGNYKLTLTVAAHVTLVSNGSKFTSITVIPADATQYNITFKKVDGATITGTYNGTPFTTASADAVVSAFNGTTVSYTVTADSGKYLSALALTSGVTNTPAFAAGATYTGTLTVSKDTTVTPTVAALMPITTKVNSSALGSVAVSPESAYPGQTVTVTVTEIGGTLNTLSWSDGTTTTNLYTKSSVSSARVSAKRKAADLAETGATVEKTFTMPASGTVSVTATFEAYSAPSDYYYNGYNKDTGAQISGFYDVRMTEAKLGGVEYSYFNVNGRTETDQTFTVSKKSESSGTRYVYFTNNNTWNSVYAYFFNGNGDVNGTWPGSAMTQNGKNDYQQDIYRIEIPSGATSVIFNDNINLQTVDIDLTNTNGSYYLNGEKDGDNWKVTEWDTPGTNSGLGTSSTEYTWDSNIYTTALGFNGGFNDHNINAINKNVAKPNNLDSSVKGNYYILVFYPGKSYSYNGLTLQTDSSKPTIVWSATLPGNEETNATVLYAKDGAAPINWDNKTAGGASALNGTAYNYAAIATTEIVSIDGNAVTATSNAVGNPSSKYQTYNVEAGQVVSIRTTIASDYRSRYYVRGFCVNGVTYYGGDGTSNNSAVNTTVDSTNGVYTLTYVVPTPAEGADLDPIEITPIYYMTDTGKDGVTFITFYLQGYRDVVDEGWGNTPYVYPFYGDLGNVNNAYGVYPGQPMVNISGTYSIEVPLKNVTINNGLSTYATTNIKGVTVNNGYADHVHRNLIYHWSTGTDSGDDKDHKQTYDYDDFFKIYEEKNGLDNKKINSITFRMMYEDTTYNADEYGYLALKDPRIHGTKSTLSAAEIETIRSSKNGWEQLTNYFNENTDIFGTKLTSTTGDPIYAISTGYNASIAGDYGTAWMIYVPDSSGTGYHLLTDADKGRYAIPPSLLFFNDTNSFSKTTLYPDASHNVVGPGDYTDSITDYKAIYDTLKADYKNCPVFVSYEMDHQDTRDKAAGTGAYRMDGHWYYTFTGDYVSSDIKIQYWDNTQQKFVDDAYSSGSVTGTTTGTKAYFTANADGTGDQTTTSGNKVMQSGYYYFSAEEATNWQFVGWYVQHGSSSPEPMTGVPMSQASVLAESSGTIIARFEPITRGDLTIYHDVDPESAGAGTATISAVVKNGPSTVATYPSSGTASSVYIPQDYITNEHSDYTIEVTLTATPTLDDAWDKFTYDSKMTPDSPTLAGGGSGIAKTSTFSFTVGDLFSNGNQTIKTLNYYSSFTATPHYYNITYNYTDRFNSEKSFTVRGTFSASDYSKYVTVDGNNRTVSGTFVKTVAPFLSNFNQNLNLNFSGASITQSYSGYTHDVTATLGSEGTTYKAMFELPYSYYDAASGNDLDGNPVKKYTGVQDNLVVGEQTMNIVKKTDINYVSVNNIAYEDYFTSNGAQTNVSKDSETVNHVNNDFITAPSQIAVQDEGQPTYHMEYFKCWSVYDYNDHNTLVTQVLYPDFHYRAYGNYYIVPEYSANKYESFALNDFDDNIGANILYLGSSRNQWNKPSAGTSSAWNDAADIIYNDFAFSFSYKGKEIVNLSNDEKAKFRFGMYIERIKTKDTLGNTIWAPSKSDGSSSYYQGLYKNDSQVFDEAAAKAGIETWLQNNKSGTPMANGNKVVGIDVPYTTDILNKKNRAEQYYYFTSQSGQTVADHEISFQTDSPVDDYVYRAYAYMIYDGTAYVSDATYFSMKNVSGK